MTPHCSQLLHPASQRPALIAHLPNHWSTRPYQVAGNPSPGPTLHKLPTQCYPCPNRPFRGVESSKKSYRNHTQNIIPTNLFLYPEHNSNQSIPAHYLLQCNYEAFQGCRFLCQGKSCTFLLISCCNSILRLSFPIIMLIGSTTFLASTS